MPTFEPHDSLRECRAILPPEVTDHIQQAAFLAHCTDDEGAEIARRFAGYGNLNNDRK